MSFILFFTVEEIELEDAAKGGKSGSKFFWLHVLVWSWDRAEATR